MEKRGKKADINLQQLIIIIIAVAAFFALLILYLKDILGALIPK